MVLLRTDIERALDELISQEEGMRFQGLAVVLGKKRWPELVAQQRKKDFGLDAYAGPELSPNGTGRGLAASITPSRSKVAGDARTAKTNFPELSTLLFITPAKIGNADRRRWSAEILGELGIELVILEREELITLMLMPENISLCGTHLHLHVELEPDIEALSARARQASATVITSWSRRAAGQPLIELSAEELSLRGEGTEQICSLEWIDTALTQAARLILEAPAGRGKTTTLIQLAHRPRATGVVILVDLPVWASSRTTILDFVAGMPAFAAVGLSPANLAAIAEREPLIFLLNGWNEITESHSADSNHALRGLERDFPSAGIIVATRTHHLTPPLPGARRLRLMRLHRSQRSTYLGQRLGDRAQTLRARFDIDPALDELTLTPLVLAEVAALVEAGADVPSTKLGILAAVLEVHERRDEHRNALSSPPIAGQSSPLLMALATEMTRRGAVSLPETIARSIVAERTRELAQLGYIDQAGGPSVLATLTAHHVLERVDYPETVYQFEHQQLQEYFAALGVWDRLIRTTRAGDTESAGFIAEYLNKPAWAEPVRMLAEQCSIAPSSGDTNALTPEVGTHLIELALTVDPMFACELAPLSGPTVWPHIANLIGERLRAIHASDVENWRDYAVAAMLATGNSDFSDVIVPRLADADQQVRLRTYRIWPDIHLVSIGKNWRDIVAAWPESAREDFVSEILHHRADASVVTFASHDPSQRVKTAAVQGLVWRGHEDLASQVLASQVLDTMDDTTFDGLLHHDLEDIPPSHRPRALFALQCRVVEAPETLARLNAWVALHRTGKVGLDEPLKEALNTLTESDAARVDLSFLQPALEHLRDQDPDWTTRWIVARLADGRLRPHTEWLAYVLDIPEDLLDNALQQLETQDLSGRRTEGMFAVAAHLATPDRAARIFGRMRELQLAIDGSQQRSDLERSLVRQLHAFMRELPDDILIQGILEVVRPGDVVDLLLFCDVLSRVARTDVARLAVQAAQLNERLRVYLLDGLDVILARDDFSGEEKANLASAISQVGESGDMVHLVRLIGADIARIEAGIASRAAGEQSARANGAVMRYTNWHIEAVLHLDAAGAVNVLVDLLAEPHYRSDAATALSRAYLPPSTSPFARTFRPELVWAARAAPLRLGDDARRDSIAAALRESITRIVEQGGSATGVARALAVVDGYGSAPLVLEAIISVNRHNQYVPVETLQRLIMVGAIVPAHAVFAVVDAILERTNGWMSDADRYLLSQALDLCAFVDDPVTGIEKIRNVLQQRSLYGGELGSVVTSLGASRSSAAVELLRELARNRQAFQQSEREFLNAFLALDDPQAREILMSFVDPGLRGLADRPQGSRYDDAVVAPLADLMARDPAFRQRLFDLCNQRLPSANRDLLSRVLAREATTAAALASLHLIDDLAHDPVPYGVSELLRRIFVEQRPHASWTNVYTQHGHSANEVRTMLFRMASENDRRCRAASTLLAQIELWRLELGRPLEEPRHPALEAAGLWPPVGDSGSN